MLFAIKGGKFLIILIIFWGSLNFMALLKSLKLKAIWSEEGVERLNLFSSRNNNTKKNIDKSWLRRKSTTKNVPRPRRSNKFWNINSNDLLDSKNFSLVVMTTINPNQFPLRQKIHPSTMPAVTIRCFPVWKITRRDKPNDCD